MICDLHKLILQANSLNDGFLYFHATNYFVHHMTPYHVQNTWWRESVCHLFCGNREAIDLLT